MMRTNKLFWALLLVPLFIECDSDEKNPDAIVSIDQLSGDWSINNLLSSPDEQYKLSLQKDGRFVRYVTHYTYDNSNTQYIYEEYKTEGSYKFEGNRLVFLSGETVFREAECDFEKDHVVYEPGDWEEWEYPEEEDVPNYPLSYDVSLKRGGTVIVLNDSDDPNGNTFFYKEGANMPSDLSGLNGTWICSFESSDYGDETIVCKYALKINGNDFELIIAHWGDRYVGKFDYKDGYVTVTKCAAYSYTGKYNWEDPFANQWRLYDDDYNYYVGFPFVVDGISACMRIDGYDLVMDKK